MTEPTRLVTDSQKQAPKVGELAGAGKLRLAQRGPVIGPTTRQMYRGAFIVTPAAVRDIKKHMLEFALSGIEPDTPCVVTAQVFSKTLNPFFIPIDELPDYRNPKATPMYGLIFAVEYRDRSATMSVDSVGVNDGATIGLSAEVRESRSTDAVYTLLSAIDREARNMRDGAAFWHRRMFDAAMSWMNKQGRLVFGFIALACLIAFLFVAVSSAIQMYSAVSRQKETATAPQSSPPPVAESKPTPPLPPPEKSPQPWRIEWGKVQPVLFNVLGLASGVILVIGYQWLFPRAIFAIGDGKERLDSLRWMRRFAIGSVFICGFILPTIRGLVPKPPIDPSATNSARP